MGTLKVWLRERNQDGNHRDDHTEAKRTQGLPMDINEVDILYLQSFVVIGQSWLL